MSASLAFVPDDDDPKTFLELRAPTDLGDDPPTVKSIKQPRMSDDLDAGDVDEPKTLALSPEVQRALIASIRGANPALDEQTNANDVNDADDFDAPTMVGGISEMLSQTGAVALRQDVVPTTPSLMLVDSNASVDHDDGEAPTLHMEKPPTPVEYNVATLHVPRPKTQPSDEALHDVTEKTKGAPVISVSAPPPLSPLVPFVPPATDPMLSAQPLPPMPLEIREEDITTAPSTTLPPEFKKNLSASLKQQQSEMGGAAGPTIDDTAIPDLPTMPTGKPKPSTVSQQALVVARPITIPPPTKAPPKITPPPVAAPFPPPSAPGVPMVGNELVLDVPNTMQSLDLDDGSWNAPQPPEPAEPAEHEPEPSLADVTHDEGGFREPTAEAFRPAAPGASLAALAGLKRKGESQPPMPAPVMAPPAQRRPPPFSSTPSSSSSPSKRAPSAPKPAPRLQGTVPDESSSRGPVGMIIGGVLIVAVVLVVGVRIYKNHAEDERPPFVLPDNAASCVKLTKSGKDLICDAPPSSLNSLSAVERADRLTVTKDLAQSAGFVRIVFQEKERVWRVVEIKPTN